jgi:hypothetical protein
MHKNKMFSLRLPERLLDEYRKMCEENSISISKRIRKYMERDIELWKEKKKERKMRDW